MMVRGVLCVAVGLGALSAGTALSQAETVTLDAEAEATIFEDPSLAVGFGRVFVGSNLQRSTRRGLVRFDLSELPEGEVVSATLELLVVSQRGFGLTFDAHRLLADWSEGPTAGNGSNGGQGGPATAADATWTQTGLGASWQAPGGDFEPTPTASAFSQSAGTRLAFDVASDVRLFRDGTAANLGWIVLSQTEPTSGNVIGISTDDEGFPAITLTVVIEESDPPCPADTNGDGLVTPSDFSAWVQAFNAQGPACDQNGDGLCTPSDFSSWVQNFNAGCG
ncbi:MAG: GC-type dockerin domain-anchored protein [Planctomycetota bacterium]